MFTLRGCDRLLNWVAQAQAFGVPFSKGAAFERCRARPAKNAGSPHKAGPSPALQADGGQRTLGRGWGEIHPQKARDGAAVLRGREERFLSSRPGAQTTRARKNRAAPLGMTGWSGARDAQPLGAGLNCDAPPALQSGWRDELAATRIGRDSSRRKRGMGRRSSLRRPTLSPLWKRPG